MLHVHGQPLTDQEVRRMIDDLRADGGPDALKAAYAIVSAAKHDRFAVRLNSRMLEAIYFVLATKQDLPDGLVELKERLGRYVLALLKIS